jgi:hypothetical protein
MKRDMTLVLDILNRIVSTETADSRKNPFQILRIGNLPYATIAYHVRLLLDESYLREDAVIVLSENSMDGSPCVKYRSDALTMAGQDFIDVLSKPDNFEELKRGLKDETWETVKVVFHQLAKKGADKFIFDDDQ